MKKKITGYLLLTLLFYSCQKEFTPESGQSSNLIPSTSDSIYIRSVVALDTTETAPLDTAYILNFTYDNTKRTLKIFGKYYDFQGPNPTNYFSNTNYFFAGTDSLPNKIIYVSGNNLGTDTTISFPSFLTGTSRLSKDSFIYLTNNPISYLILNYNYSGNNVTTSENEYSIGNPSVIRNQSFQITKTNGNIVSENQNNSAATYNCIYDTKPNPLQKNYFEQNQYYDFLIADPNFVDDPIFYLQKNNILESIVTRGTATSHKIFRYKYNNLNYPYEITLQTITASNNIHSANKIKFYYTN